MYQYLWDEETGGLLLTTEQSKFSKEPRPVYASELTLAQATLFFCCVRQGNRHSTE